MIEEVLRFKDNNQELVLLRENKKFSYAKIQDGKLNFSLTNQEIKLIKQVLLAIIPSDSLAFVGYFKLNNENYNHYYDFLNGRHHFLKDNQTLPNIDDYIILNKIFNCHDFAIKSRKNTYDAGSEYDIPLTPKMKTLVKIGKKVLVVFLTLTTLLAIDDVAIRTSGTYNSYKHLLALKFQTAVEELTNDLLVPHLTYQEIEETINNNPNLSPSEKALYLADREFLESQLPYINKEDYLDTLRHLFIIYNPESRGDVKGEYYAAGSMKYGIQMYETSSYEETKKDTIVHENGHTVSDKEALTNPNFPFVSPFYEFLNREIKNEYKSIERSRKEGLDHSYDYLTTYFLRFAKLFSSDTLRKFHAVPYEKYLISELLTIIPDVNLAYNLFQELYNYDISYKALLGEENLLSLKSKEEWQLILETAKKNLDSMLKRYYEVKFKNVLEDESDMEIIYLYDKEQALSIIRNSTDELSFLSLDYIVNNTFVASWPNLFNHDQEKNFILSLRLPNSDKKIQTIGLDLTNFSNLKNNFSK